MCQVLVMLVLRDVLHKAHIERSHSCFFILKVYMAFVAVLLGLVNSPPAVALEICCVLSELACPVACCIATTASSAECYVRYHCSSWFALAPRCSFVFALALVDLFDLLAFLMLFHMINPHDRSLCTCLRSPSGCAASSGGAISVTVAFSLSSLSSAARATLVLPDLVFPLLQEPATDP